MSEVQKALRDLLDRIDSVTAYVGATVGRGNTFPHDFKGHGDPSDWRLAHAGRLASSERQLSALQAEALAVRALAAPPEAQAREASGKPCTCSQQGAYCRGAATLGAGWYCERAAERPAPPAEHALAEVLACEHEPAAAAPFRLRRRPLAEVRAMRRGADLALGAAVELLREHPAAQKLIAQYREGQRLIGDVMDRLQGAEARLAAADKGENDA